MNLANLISKQSYLEWRAREREVKDALGGGHV